MNRLLQNIVDFRDTVDTITVLWRDNTIHTLHKINMQLDVSHDRPYIDIIYQILSTSLT